MFSRTRQSSMLLCSGERSLQLKTAKSHFTSYLVPFTFLRPIFFAAVDRVGMEFCRRTKPALLETGFHTR